MTIQLSTTLRTNRADQVETTIGTAPTLELRTGAQPADCATADSGTVVASIVLPSDWLTGAGVVKSINGGPWQDASADNAGTIGHFRLKAGATCHMQGSVTATAGGGDMTVDNPTLTAGQQFNVTAFTLTEGGA